MSLNQSSARTGFVLSSDKIPRARMKTKMAMLAAAIMLAACGGGGDSPVSSAQAAPLPASAPASTSTPVPSGGFDGNLTGQNIPPSVQTFIKFGNAPFFDGALFSMDTSFPDSTHVQMDFAVVPTWTGNILFRNNTTGVSVVLSRTISPAQNPVWQATTNPPNLIRNGITDSFTVELSN